MDRRDKAFAAHQARAARPVITGDAKASVITEALAQIGLAWDDGNAVGLE